MGTQNPTKSNRITGKTIITPPPVSRLAGLTRAGDPGERGGHFRSREVDASSIVEFLDRYYKPDRFRERGIEYAEALIKSHQADFDKHGYDIISRHDSVTGRVVAYFGKEQS